MRMLRSLLFLGSFSIAKVYCFALRANFGKYSVKSINKDDARVFFSSQRVIKSLSDPKSNLLKFFEITDAETWCKSHESDDSCMVSAVCKENRSMYYMECMILYRFSGRILTVDAIYRNAEVYSRNGNNITISTLDVFRMLRRLCEPLGYLQTYPIRTWSDGRYWDELLLEKCASD